MVVLSTLFAEMLCFHLIVQRIRHAKYTNGQVLTSDSHNLELIKVRITKTVLHK